jgi:hypothetical protein
MFLDDTSYAETIVFDDFNYQQDIFIIMERMIFQNLEYKLKGSPLKFKSFVKHNIEVKSSVLQNSTSALIIIHSSSKDSASYSIKTKFTNFTARNNEALSSTMIQAQEGSSLEITDSLFENNFSYETGSILSISSPSSTVTITDSEFTNNAAKEGGVFNIFDEGTLSCTN